jgi:hypothetical protein
MSLYSIDFALDRTAWKSQFMCRNLNLHFLHFVFFFLFSLFGCHRFLLGFISSLPRIAWDKRLCCCCCCIWRCRFTGQLKRTISMALFHRQFGVTSLLRETEALFCMILFANVLSANLFEIWMCNVFLWHCRDFQNNSLDTIPAAFEPPKAVILLYVLPYQFILPAYIYRYPSFSCMVCLEYENFIDEFNADPWIQTNIILITRTCKPNHFSFWCDNNHYHRYSTGFLETLFVTLLMQLGQPDFVNPHL